MDIYLRSTCLECIFFSA